jgi:hypothetical protein
LSHKSYRENNLWKIQTRRKDNTATHYDHLMAPRKSSSRSIWIFWSPSAQWGCVDRTISEIGKPTAQQMPSLAQSTSDAGNDGLIRKRSWQWGILHSRVLTGREKFTSENTGLCYYLFEHNAYSFQNLFSQYLTFRSLKPLMGWMTDGSEFKSW